MSSVKLFRLVGSNPCVDTLWIKGRPCAFMNGRGVNPFWGPRRPRRWKRSTWEKSEPKDNDPDPWFYGSASDAKETELVSTPQHHFLQLCIIQHYPFLRFRPSQCPKFSMNKSNWAFYVQKLEILLSATPYVCKLLLFSWKNWVRKRSSHLSPTSFSLPSPAPYRLHLFYSK